MTTEQALQAIANNDIVQIKGEPERWGVITCLSDDGSTAYIKPKGMGFFRYGITLNKIEVPDLSNHL